MKSAAASGGFPDMPISRAMNSAPQNLPVNRRFYVCFSKSEVEIDERIVRVHDEARYAEDEQRELNGISGGGQP